MADLSPGARLVQEWNAYLHEQGGYVGPTYRDDLARRIDAALAERDRVVEMAAARVTEIAAERDAGKKGLAEADDLAAYAERFAKADPGEVMQMIAEDGSNCDGLRTKLEAYRRARGLPLRGGE